MRQWESWIFLNLHSTIVILTTFHSAPLWTLCTFNSTVFKQPGGNLAPRTVPSLCAMWSDLLVVCSVFVSLTTGVQNAVFFLIVHMSACGLFPSNELPRVCAKRDKVTSSCLVPLQWTRCGHTVNTLMLWQPMKHTNSYNEGHLKTTLTFCTRICKAELHRDCMPFKKGQINIAQLWFCFSCSLHKFRHLFWIFWHQCNCYKNDERIKIFVTKKGNQ